MSDNCVPPHRPHREQRLCFIGSNLDYTERFHDWQVREREKQGEALPLERQILTATAAESANDPPERERPHNRKGDVSKPKKMAGKTSPFQ